MSCYILIYCILFFTQSHKHLTFYNSFFPFQILFPDLHLRISAPPSVLPFFSVSIVLCEQAGQFDVTREITFPISLDNEEKVLRHIGRICMNQLKEYETSWEEDTKTLSDPEGPKPFTNERNALIYMAGEKEICHYYIDLMMEGVKYIRMLKTRDVNTARQLQSMLREKYADHDQVNHYSGSCEYVSHVIIQLLKKTFRMVSTGEEQPPRQGASSDGGRPNNRR